mmetsp:Transcript_12161/g.28872  ORF Transcript_12161/g.28872 Transcript_12161/m.28872 type:complete len:256 (+) Transcript_12161:418-1185(+)
MLRDDPEFSRSNRQLYRINPSRKVPLQDDRELRRRYLPHQAHGGALLLLRVEFVVVLPDDELLGFGAGSWFQPQEPQEVVHRRVPPRRVILVKQRHDGHASPRHEPDGVVVPPGVGDELGVTRDLHGVLQHDAAQGAPTELDLERVLVPESTVREKAVFGPVEHAHPFFVLRFVAMALPPSFFQMQSRHNVIERIPNQMNRFLGDGRRINRPDFRPVGYSFSGATRSFESFDRVDVLVAIGNLTGIAFSSAVRLR